MIRALLATALLSANIAMAADPALPAQDVVVPLVKDGIAIHDPALNVLLAMQIRGCITLDISPISYTWHQVKSDCE